MTTVITKKQWHVKENREVGKVYTNREKLKNKLKHANRMLLLKLHVLNGYHLKKISRTPTSR